MPPVPTAASAAPWSMRSDRAGHEVLRASTWSTGSTYRDGPSVGQCRRRGVEVVVHLTGGQARDGAAEPATMMGTNVGGTWNVLSAAARARRGAGGASRAAWDRVRGLHRPPPARLPPDRRRPSGLRVLPAYGASKHLGEELCAVVTRTSGMTTICLRIPRVRAGPLPAGASSTRPGTRPAVGRRLGSTGCSSTSATSPVRSLAGVDVGFDGRTRLLVAAWRRDGERTADRHGGRGVPGRTKWHDTRPVRRRPPPAARTEHDPCPRDPRLVTGPLVGPTTLLAGHAGRARWRRGRRDGRPVPTTSETERVAAARAWSRRYRSRHQSRTGLGELVPGGLRRLQQPQAARRELIGIVGDEEVSSRFDGKSLHRDTRRDDGYPVRERLEHLDPGAATPRGAAPRPRRRGRARPPCPGPARSR